MKFYKYDVVIVGGGPAGLAAATELRDKGVRKVVVLDRESEMGGIPRHCHHPGFGVLDLGSFFSGPAYARKRVRLAQLAGVVLECETTVTGWTESGLKTTSPKGLREFSARAVVLATGCRERPRTARMIPGDRPSGVYTTGSLQQLVYFNRQNVGKKAVVVGAEHVSFSALHTLETNGTRVAALITEHSHHQTYPVFKWMTSSLRRVPVMTQHRVVRILGKNRVEAVEVQSCLDRSVHRIECDTVVFTGDWIPDHELARMGGLIIDPGTLGPRVGFDLSTSRPGVFAAGNLLHGAEIADVAAIDGVHVAGAVRRYLHNGNVELLNSYTIPIEAQAPLRWIYPNALTRAFDGSPALLPPRGKLILRVGEVLKNATIQVSQGDQVFEERSWRVMLPNRPYYLGTGWRESVKPGDEPVRVSVLS